MITRTFLLALLLVSSFVSQAAAQQSRDHLTQQEVDLVKEAQVLDKRIEVFIKAAERRLMVINGSAAGDAKQLKKDSERWGELPTGSRAELVTDIARILDEAITNIDDVSSRDERNHGAVETSQRRGQERCRDREFRVVARECTIDP